DVNDLRALGQLPFEPVAKKPIETDQKSGQRLARTRRGRDQGVFFIGGFWPAANLRLRRLPKAALEPLTNERMEEIERHLFIVPVYAAGTTLTIAWQFLSTFD